MILTIEHRPKIVNLCGLLQFLLMDTKISFIIYLKKAKYFDWNSFSFT